MTRHATALDAKRASAALPAGAAANGGGAPRKTLSVLRMAWGGDRVDKRGLPAEQGKGVNAVHTRESGRAPPEGVGQD